MKILVKAMDDLEDAESRRKYEMNYKYECTEYHGESARWWSWQNIGGKWKDIRQEIVDVDASPHNFLEHLEKHLNENYKSRFPTDLEKLVQEYAKKVRLESYLKEASLPDTKAEVSLGNNGLFNAAKTEAIKKWADCQIEIEKTLKTCFGPYRGP